RDTERDLPGAAALEKPRSKAQLFGRFCAGGNGWPLVLHIHESLARAFARQASSRPEETGGGLFPCPGKQKPGVGLHPETTACVRGWAKTQTRCANCPPQVCPPQPRVRARHGEERDTVRDLPGAAALEKPRSKAQLFK